MNRIVENISNIIYPIIEAKNAMLIETKIRRIGHTKMVEIYIDTEKGVTTDFCAEVSREISRALDIANIIKGEYQLVVSSPGTDRPLKYIAQYPKNIGRLLTIKYHDLEDVKIMDGELVEIRDDYVYLKVEDEEIKKIYFPNIIEARVNTIW